MSFFAVVPDAVLSSAAQAAEIGAAITAAGAAASPTTAVVAAAAGDEVANTSPSQTLEVAGWRDRKRYLWLLGVCVPGLVGLSWIGVTVTGLKGFWWCGAILTFFVVPVLDHLVGPDVDNPPDSALAWLEQDRFYRCVTYLFIPAQYLSLLLACWLWAGGGWLNMSFADKLGLMVSVGIIGGCAINAAHGIGHKHGEAEKWLSKVALAQTCYGHFYVEHNRGHHVWVATPEDPASSRLGESLYHFVPRSVVGGLRSAWAIETRRFVRMQRSRWSLANDVLNAWLLSAALYVVLAVWFRPVVLPWLVGQAVVGIMLLEIVNYLEHYGLRRKKISENRYEPVNRSHSWNSNTVIANILLFHLQRHSDHHAHPGRRYQALRHANEAPQLPTGYPALILAALIPPLWRRIMDKRVLEHYGGDIRLAAVRPRGKRPQSSWNASFGRIRRVLLDKSELFIFIARQPTRRCSSQRC